MMVKATFAYTLQLTYLQLNNQVTERKHGNIVIVIGL